MPEISVIVLNWNGKRFLETCLMALRAQRFRDFEAILVDNGSEDGSQDYVRGNFPEVTMIELRDNLGFAGGNIAGYERARGNLVILLNNDTEADPHWLEEIHTASRDYPDAGSFASKMMFFDERDRIDNCGFDLTTIGTGVELGRGEPNGPNWRRPREVFGACAGAAAYRRTMLEDVGFLDERYFATFEDLDLSFRAQLRGYRCVFIPGAIVYHRLTATIKMFPARQAFFVYRNIDLVYLENMPLVLMLRFLPARIIFEVGCALYSFRQGVGGAFLWAKLSVIREFPSAVHKRTDVLRTRRLTNSQLRTLMHSYLFRSRWKRFASVWRNRPAGRELADRPKGPRNAA